MHALLLLQFILVNTLASAASAETRPALQLVVEPGPWSVGAPTLKVSVLNRSARPVWMNGRMLVNSEDAAPEIRELWLDIRDSANRPHGFNCRIRAGAATREDYVSLEGGGRFEKLVSIRCFDIQPNQSYRIVAHYRDGTPSPPRPARKAVLARDEVVSAQVEINIPPQGTQ